MKTIVRLLFVSMLLLSSTLGAQEFFSVTGRVQDAATKKSLSFASIQLLTTNISNVSNSEGIFVLKIPNHTKADTVFISYL